MAGIMFLPSELLGMVCNHLQTRDLAKLLLTCKGFRKVVEPWLYKHIRFMWPPSGRSPPFCRLLCNLVSRPELAEQIKRLSFQGNDFQGSQPAGIWWLETRFLPFASERELLRSTISQYHVLTAYSSWQADFDCGDTDLFIAALLLLVPKLEYLELGLKFQNHTSYITSALRQALPITSVSGQSLILSGLKEVVFSVDVLWYEPSFWDDYEAFRYNAEQLLALFYLPSITKLDVFMPGPRIAEWPWTPPSAATITTLSIRWSQANETALEQLLLATPNLKTLKYDLHFPFWEEGEEDQIELNCKTLDRALLRVRRTLENLTLSTDQTGPVQDLQDGSGWILLNNLSVLPRFEKLKTLKVPKALLLGWHPRLDITLSRTLPPNICYFELSDDLSDHYGYRYNNPLALFAYLREYFEREHHLRSICRWQGPVRDLRAICGAGPFSYTVTAHFLRDRVVYNIVPRRRT